MPAAQAVHDTIQCCIGDVHPLPGSSVDVAESLPVSDVMVCIRRLIGLITIR